MICTCLQPIFNSNKSKELFRCSCSKSLNISPPMLGMDVGWPVAICLFIGVSRAIKKGHRPKCRTLPNYSVHQRRFLKLQHPPPCILPLRGGVLSVQLRGWALIASSQEQSEWATYHFTLSMLLPWLPTLRIVS